MQWQNIFYDQSHTDKTNLVITWLEDEGLEDTENLPPPDAIARDITENLQSALEQFNSIREELEENEKES